MSLAEIVEKARAMGMGAVCITDHDSLGIREEAERYSRETGFPIFVGVEVLTVQGDIVAFGSPFAFQPRTIDAQEFIRYVHSYGGACFSAHPFRNNQRGLEEHLAAVRGLDGVEVLNGSTSLEANRKALEYALRLGIQPRWGQRRPRYEAAGQICDLAAGGAPGPGGLYPRPPLRQMPPAVWEDGAFRVVDSF